MNEVKNNKPAAYMRTSGRGNVLKSKTEYFQATLDGRKPFEIRKDDRGFRQGDMYILAEVSEVKWWGECPRLESGMCEARAWASEQGYGEDEAIDYCGRTARAHCYEHTTAKYTGREILIRIREIFDLSPAGIEDYVAFTFDVLWTTEGEKCG